MNKSDSHSVILSLNKNKKFVRNNLIIENKFFLKYKVTLKLATIKERFLKKIKINRNF